jgi:hypothetical protein
VDDVFLAFENTAVTKETPRAPAGAELVAIAPDVVVAPDTERGVRATVGVVGRF